MSIYKCKYFDIKELVSPQVYNRYKDFCWKFFRAEFLQDIDTIREFHGSITINNWMYNGANTQCGLRCNMDPLVKSKNGIYCSSHLMGIAADLHSNNIKKLYEDVKSLHKQGKLVAITRIESPDSTGYKWCHVDCFQTADSSILEVFKG